MAAGGFGQPRDEPAEREPTFGGKTYSQWLRELETERKPETLAEAVRACEEAGGATFDDRTANAQARAADCGFEEKIVCRARAHPSSQDISAALGSFRLTLKIAIGLGAALAFAAAPPRPWCARRSEPPWPGARRSPPWD